MEKTSEAILALQTGYVPLQDRRQRTYRNLVWSPKKLQRWIPSLVLPDKQGKPYTVRYEAVNAMLLNEFLKEHRKVEQLEKQIETLTAGLQNVSAQLEANKPASKVVANQ